MRQYFTACSFNHYKATFKIGYTCSSIWASESDLVFVRSFKLPYPLYSIGVKTKFKGFSKILDSV